MSTLHHAFVFGFTLGLIVTPVAFLFRHGYLSPKTPPSGKEYLRIRYLYWGRFAPQLVVICLFCGLGSLLT
jgi:hypothetical protein